MNLHKNAAAVILFLLLIIPILQSAQNSQLSHARNTAIGADISSTYAGNNENAYACDYVCGDANGDGSVNVSDAVYIINYVFIGGDIPFPIEAGDANGDGSCNVSDAVFIINHVFIGGPAPVACPYLINIVNLQQGDNTVHGTANILDTALYRVVLWAKTDRWYVQPSVANPYTFVQGDGTWSNSTYPWDRMVALLVDLSYVPGSTRDYHPSMDPGVVCWDEYPDKSIKYFNWSNYRWRIKKGDLLGPGPNYFSDDTVNVWIDQDKRLHLKIDYRDDIWYCSEVVLDHSLGYGLYTFKVDSRVDNLDYNTIFAGFIYETINEEFDIEFSQRLAAPFNALYVAQPWYTPGNIEFFNMPNSSQTSHSFEWRSDRIICNSWNGHSDTPTGSTLIHTWTYTGEDIPIPGGERMIFNLYLFGGEVPVQGLEDEAIITSFQYTE
ncbi:MAG: hypothetical protein GF310_06225 [candidate division Zixibacteria bacterium]|nr:hypothetical protein [candidate division Zixibacteria bacterium]